MQVVKLSIDQIIQNENSRGKHKENDLAQLMSSIKKDGLLHPIGVRPFSKRRKGKEVYEVVFGNRRFEAVKKLGFNEISASIVNAESEKDFIVLNLIENAQRSDVTAYEQGRLYKKLIGDESMSVAEIAVRVGVTQSNVKACLNAFDDTPEEFRDKVKVKKGGVNQRQGDIPISLSEKIVQISKNHNLTMDDRRALYKAVQNGALDINNLARIAALLSQKVPLKKAIKNIDRYQYVNVKVPLYRDEVVAYKEEWDYPITKELVDIIYRSGEFTKPF